MSWKASKWFFVACESKQNFLLMWLLWKLRNSRFSFGRAGYISGCHKHICHLRTVACIQLTNSPLKMHFSSWPIRVHISLRAQHYCEWQLIFGFNKSTFLYLVWSQHHPDLLNWTLTQSGCSNVLPARHPNPSCGWTKHLQYHSTRSPEVVLWRMLGNWKWTELTLLESSGDWLVFPLTAPSYLPEGHFSVFQISPRLCFQSPEEAWRQ